MFSLHYPIYVMRCLVSGFFDPEPPQNATQRLGLRPMSITFPDAGLPPAISLSLSLARARTLSKSHRRAADAVRCCVDVALEKLPSRCESFFIFVPHSGVFRHLVRRRNLFNLPLIVEAFH